MFILRLFKHILILLLISLPLQLLGLVLVPIGIKLVGDNLRLPAYLKWFDSADVWLGRDTSTYEGVIKEGFWKRYYWLAIRNPTNYFGYCILGAEVTETPTIIYSNYNYLVGDSFGKKPGLLSQEVSIGKETIVYEYYYILKWNETHCLRFRLGFKVGIPDSNKKYSYIQQVLVFQPYKSYSGL